MTETSTSVYLYEMSTSSHKNHSNESTIVRNWSPCRFLLFGAIGTSSVGIWDVMLLIPNVLFMIFLLSKIRRIMMKLRKNDSPIFTVCVVLVCLANLISLLRCVISMSLPEKADEKIDRVMWLLLKFFLLATELSVIVFGFMFGHLDSRRSIRRVLMVTFAVSLAYSVSQGGLEFLSPNEKFHNITVATGDSYKLYGHGGLMFWFVSSVVLALIYIAVCVVPFTPIRQRFAIPTRKSFYIYCLLLAILNVTQAIGCALLYFTTLHEGWCLIDVTSYLYFTGFAPLIYVTFLRNFFVPLLHPSVQFSYRSQIDDAGDEADSSLPYPASSYGPVGDPSINGVGEPDEHDLGAVGGFQPLAGWHEAIVGVPELKASHSRFFTADQVSGWPESPAKNVERISLQA